MQCPESSDHGPGSSIDGLEHVAAMVRNGTENGETQELGRKETEVRVQSSVPQAGRWTGDTYEQCEAAVCVERVAVRRACGQLSVDD